MRGGRIRDGPTELMCLLFVGLQWNHCQMCVELKAPNLLVMESVIHHTHPHHKYLVLLIRVSSQRLAWFIYHTYHFTDVCYEAHPVEEFSQHVRLPLDPLLPHRCQEAVLQIGKGYHITSRTPEPIQYRFLPEYFRHLMKDYCVNYHIVDGGG